VKDDTPKIARMSAATLPTTAPAIIPGCVPCDPPPAIGTTAADEDMLEAAVVVNETKVSDPVKDEANGAGEIDIVEG
jgi:hypothetical protein